MRIDLSNGAKHTVEKLRAAGYAAYAVGGCVRDSLMGVPPKDWDVTTSAPPEEMLHLFAAERVIETGLKHGTVTVLFEGEPVEVTTFRADGAYSDHRRPDAVTFVADIKEDLARRDFTVNAMAYSAEEGLLDPFGGQVDLKDKIIRCVGDPEKRFAEDALRIMRALRFSSRLGFAIEEKTDRAIRAMAGDLRRIAGERLAVELTGLLCGADAFRVLADCREVLAVFLPGLAPMFDFDQHNPHHIYDTYTHTCHVVATVPPDRALRLAALYHDAGKPHTFTTDEAGRGHFYGHPAVSAKIAARDLNGLHMDNAALDRVKLLIENHDADIDLTIPSIKRFLNRMGEEAFRQLLLLKRADNLAQSPAYRIPQEEFDRAEELLDEIIEKGNCFTLKDLAVKGSDLIGLGIPAGKDIGRVLKILLDAVIEERAENDKGVLLELAEREYGTK